MKSSNNQYMSHGAWICSILAITFFLSSGCKEESTPPPPSSDYYVIYSWEGEAEYAITYWLQSNEQQYSSNSTGSAASQGNYTSPTISHTNNLDLVIKTAIQYSDIECANVQMTLYRDSIAVLSRDYVMGNPENQNCTAEDFRQATYTP